MSQKTNFNFCFLGGCDRHRFILVAIDYFTKWVEASSYAHVTQKVVKKFIEKDLICRYGPPDKIVTDNA